MEKNGLYLYLHNHVMHQLREEAKRHQRTVASEVTQILEETFRPGCLKQTTVEDAAGGATVEKCNANGIYVDLSEELLARIRPLAERNYRSLAGEVASVLERVLSLTELEAGKTAASKPKPTLSLNKKRQPPKPAVKRN